VAQSIITLLEFKDLSPDAAPENAAPENVRLAHSVFSWAMNNLWDDRGFFYYRVLRLGKVRTSYMRWSQAWMLLALAELMRASGGSPEPAQKRLPAQVDRAGDAVQV
jgi:hypothetical protein